MIGTANEVHFIHRAVATSDCVVRARGPCRWCHRAPLEGLNTWKMFFQPLLSMHGPRGCTRLYCAQGDQNGEQYCEKDCGVTFSVNGHFFFLKVFEDSVAVFWL